MEFIKKPLKAAIQLVSTVDFHADDVKIANVRTKRIQRAFHEFGMSFPTSYNGNETYCVLLGEMPDLIKLTLKVKPINRYFALVENNREHRFMVAGEWDWRPDKDTIPLRRDQLHEEVMEFINDYSDLD